MTTIRVGAKPQQFKTWSRFWDGKTANERVIEAVIDERGPSLMLADHGHWPLSDLRILRDQAGKRGMILRAVEDDLMRLEIDDPEAQRILRARCPDIGRALPFRNFWRLVLTGVAAVASVAAMILFLIPFLANQLAEILPPEGEKALGDSTFHQIRSALSGNGLLQLETCVAPEGQEALKKLADRLIGAQELPYELSVHVLDDGMVNAFALPGGYIVFFRGLIEAAERPEELAAVFAHELGHVAERDPTRIALRSAGSIGILGLLLGDFAGGSAVLFLTNRLVQADYTQDAEAAADTFAHASMAAANLDPAALGTLFKKLSRENGDADGFVQHLMSHPSLGDRVKAAENAAKPNVVETLLSDAEWAALQAICTDTE